MRGVSSPAGLGPVLVLPVVVGGQGEGRHLKTPNTLHLNTPNTLHIVKQCSRYRLVLRAPDLRRGAHPAQQGHAVDRLLLRGDRKIVALL